MREVISKEEQREVRKKQITLLVQSYYERLPFLQYEPLNLLIEKALDLFLDSDLTIDEINDKLLEAIASRKKDLDDRYDSEKVRENHEVIYGQLEQLARELNAAGVDYQLAGALCGYLSYQEESSRCHDDIDLYVNEKDLGKFHQVCDRLGLSFSDRRFDSPRVLKNEKPSGEHEVVASNPEDSFHVGVFPFERKENGEVVTKNYYHAEDGSPWVREEVFSSDAAHEIFGHQEVDFRGTPLTITPPEYIYHLKMYTAKQKDQYDMQFLDSRMDGNRYDKIVRLCHEGKSVQNIPISSNTFQEQVDSVRGEDEERELQQMLSDHGMLNDDSKNNSREKEGAKVFVKKKDEPVEAHQEQQATSNEDGFISNTIITTLALITFVLCFIGIAVLYLIQM